MSPARSSGARAALARAQRTALTVVLSIFVGSWVIVGGLLAPIAGGWLVISAAAVLFTVLPLAIFIRSRGSTHYPGKAIRLHRLPANVVCAAASHALRDRRWHRGAGRSTVRRRRHRWPARDRDRRWRRPALGTRWLRRFAKARREPPHGDDTLASARPRGAPHRANLRHAHRSPHLARPSRARRRRRSRRDART